MDCRPAGRDAAELDLGAEAALFRALGDETRLTMLATLAGTDAAVCVCEFTEALPLNQPTVSHHLRILREAELVTCERRGTWVYYRLAPAARNRLDTALNDLFQAKVSS